jgi:superfamily II DNA or RNA helicase
VAHAQAVADQWRRAGYRAVAVHGGSDDRERREAVAGLRAGRLDLVACAQLWIAGVDVPEIDVVIWLRPTQSLTAWLQGNGRGLRIAAGKRDLIILDHVGNCGRLGHPLQVHEWSLDGRRKQQREQSLACKVCPKCFSTSISTARVCAECGHVFAPTERRELQTVEGELVELAAAARERKREQGSAQSLEDLRQLAQQRGYKRGWAERVYQARLAKRHAI